MCINLHFIIITTGFPLCSTRALQPEWHRKCFMFSSLHGWSNLAPCISCCLSQMYSLPAQERHCYPRPHLCRWRTLRALSKPRHLVYRTLGQGWRGLELHIARCCCQVYTVSGEALGTVMSPAGSLPLWESWQQPPQASRNWWLPLLEGVQLQMKLQD